jgi:hypothetical protein
MCRDRRAPLFFAAALGILFVLSSSSAHAAPGKCEVVFIVDSLCEAGKTVGQAAGKVATAPIKYAAGTAVEMITSWVADGAQWIMGKVINFIDQSSSPTLDASWFAERYRFMVGLAALVLLPILMIATIHAIVTQDLTQLLRSFFVYLPLAILGTFVAVHIAQALLGITDALSAAVARGIAKDVSQIFDSVGKTLSHSVGPVSPTTPSFAVFIGALLVIVGSFLVWLELLVRSAAVTVCVFFLPLTMVSLVWPATMQWLKRLIEILVALILSKFVIVAVISLATAGLSNPGGGGFGTIMGAAALMLMASLSPFALLKLMPLAEGAAIGHLQGMARGPIETLRPGGAVNQATSVMRSKMQARGAAGLAVAGPQPAPGVPGSPGGTPNAPRTPPRGARRTHDPGKRDERGGDAVAARDDDAPGRAQPSKPKAGGRVAPPSARPRPETEKRRKD